MCVCFFVFFWGGGGGGRGGGGICHVIIETNQRNRRLLFNLMVPFNNLKIQRHAVVLSREITTDPASWNQFHSL